MTGSRERLRARSTAVGSDEQVVLVDEAQHRREVLVDLARRPDAVLGEDVAYRPGLEVSAVDPVGDPPPVHVVDEDHPRRPHFKTSEAEGGEQAHHVPGQQRGDAVDRRGLLIEEVGLGGLPARVGQEDLGRALVEADRHVEALGLLVDIEEVVVPHQMACLAVALLQHAAGAVVLGEAELLDRRRDIAERGHAHPAQPARGHRRSLGHPTVVAAGQLHLHLGATGRVAVEDGRVDHLDVDAELVHVAQPGVDVEQLPGSFGGPGVRRQALGLVHSVPVDGPVVAGCRRLVEAA